MQRDIVDPAPLRVGGEHLGLALGVERDQLAVVAAEHDALAVRRRAEDAAAATSTLLSAPSSAANVTASSAPTNAALSPRKYAAATGAPISILRTRSVTDGDGGLRAGGIELDAHDAMQLSKPSRIACSGNSRPMKTMRLSRFSPSFHFRWWSPSSIMCTPWKT